MNDELRVNNQKLETPNSLPVRQAANPELISTP